MSQTARTGISGTDLRSSLNRFDDCGFDGRPWLILGKGPSYSKIASIDLRRYNVLAINHVVEKLEWCEIAHMADWETFLASGNAAALRARYLCMPYVPYIGFKPSPKPLDQLANESPLLKRLIESRRVLTYNLAFTSTSGRLNGFADVHLSHFSSEAVIDFLGSSAVARILSLGVDGGTAYSTAFSNLVDKTLLASGQPTYDYQFDGIAYALLRTGVEYRPLDIRGPVQARILYGRGESLAADVLAYSIQRHSPLKVEIAMKRRPCWTGPVAAGHCGLRVESHASSILEFDARSLVVANLMPLYRRVFSESVIRPLELAFTPDHRALHRATRRQWFERFARRAVAMFDRSACVPWKSASAAHHAAWMTALREAVYWKRVPIRKVRAAIARGNVSPGIFESMSQASDNGRA